MARCGETRMSKAEIDTSAPFRSVKEAVILFGEKVLAGEVYAINLKELQEEHGEETNELEETKQKLEKAREESTHMALCLSSLQQELEQTKRELHLIKNRDSEKHVLFDSEMEDLKFVENSTESIFNKEMVTNSRGDQKSINEFQKKYVTFANPPSVARVIAPPPSPPGDEVLLQRHPSLKKKKKKPLIPLIGGIFSKIKRGNSGIPTA